MTLACYKAYRKSAVQSTDSKEQILLKLYDGALKFLKIARRGIEQKLPKVRGENISKVLAILTELDTALDHQNGSELTRNLSGLYGYMIDRLTEANLKNETAPLDEAARLLNEIRSGFAQAARTLAEAKTLPIQENAPQPEERLSFAV